MCLALAELTDNMASRPRFPLDFHTPPCSAWPLWLTSGDGSKVGAGPHTTNVLQEKPLGTPPHTDFKNMLSLPHGRGTQQNLQKATPDLRRACQKHRSEAQGPAPLSAETACLVQLLYPDLLYCPLPGYTAQHHWQPITEFHGGARAGPFLPERGFLKGASLVQGPSIRLAKTFSELHFHLKLFVPSPSLCSFTGLRPAL